MGKLGMHVLDIAQGKPGAGAPMHQLDIAMMFPHFSLFAICANGLVYVMGAVMEDGIRYGVECEQAFAVRHRLSALCDQPIKLHGACSG